MKLSREQQDRIAALYDANYVLLLCYAESVLRDRDRAEEAVQETFRVACTRADMLSASDNPGGWLMNTLKNILRSRKRHFARFRRIFSEVPLDEAYVKAPAPSEDLDLLISMLLTQEEYRLYQKLIVVGEPMAKAAAELGISLSACKKRAQRIREKLQRDFQA